MLVRGGRFSPEYDHGNYGGGGLAYLIGDDRSAAPRILNRCAKTKKMKDLRNNEDEGRGDLYSLECNYGNYFPPNHGAAAANAGGLRDLIGDDRSASAAPRVLHRHANAAASKSKYTIAEKTRGLRSRECDDAGTYSDHVYGNYLLRLPSNHGATAAKGEGLRTLIGNDRAATAPRVLRRHVNAAVYK